jgi:hypothetical protein
MRTSGFLAQGLIGTEMYCDLIQGVKLIGVLLGITTFRRVVDERLRRLIQPATDPNECIHVGQLALFNSGQGGSADPADFIGCLSQTEVLLISLVLNESRELVYVNLVSHDGLAFSDDSVSEYKQCATFKTNFLFADMTHRPDGATFVGSEGRKSSKDRLFYRAFSRQKELLQP